MIKILHYALLITLITITSTLAQSPSSINEPWKKGFTNALKNTHDVALPSWGPYSNKFNGLSHVPAENNGFRFDIVVQPSQYLRSQTMLANVQRESNYHPWQATSDLSYFSYRFELEWKDKVYCDVSFSKVDEQSRLIKADFVNNTENNRSLALNVFSSMMFPFEKSIGFVLPAGANWKRAADYTNFTDSVKSWNYNLVYNGQLRGQSTDDGAASGTAISFGRNRGEKLTYTVQLQRNLIDGVLLLRYKTITGTVAKLKLTLNGKVLENTVLPSNPGYALSVIPAGRLFKGDMLLTIEIDKSAAIKLDGFSLIEKSAIAEVKFTEEKPKFIPKQLSTDLPNAVLLKYDNIKTYYGMVWSDLLANKRDLYHDNPDEALAIFNNLVKNEKHGPATRRINGNNNGWFKNVFFAPIILKSKQKMARYIYVVAGNTAEEVLSKLKSFNAKWETAEGVEEKQRSQLSFVGHNKAGEQYRFSQQLMEATTLTNLIYPTFTANQFVKHTTPGKRWSSLYTWDSGFIGLGYAALDLDRAVESLNAYTMDDTEQSAFLEHGTPLPVQAYLFNELWNKTQNIEYLAYFYPRLKRFYNYLGGGESSSTRKLKSNLIKTWDIFYNSGGWDDYAPQVFVHREKLESTVAPTINTSHQIRFAKLLKMAATQLGLKQDIASYDADVKTYTDALQKYAWDKDAGYFGYVKHNVDGKATGILRHESGSNFNRGIDGCSPLIAGICTPIQTKKIVGHLFSKQELWTDQGITTIDQSAPYYDKDGYWNGRVWLAHQWFFWKTMLDVNEPEKAIQIAETALKVWKRETDDTYNCWENFSVETGNGGGWHQFGALSSPILNWYAALFKQGTLTHGFNVWPTASKFNADKDGFNGKFKFFSDNDSRNASMIVCLNDKYQYDAKCNGKIMSIQQILPGLYVLRVELGAGDHDTFNLEITKKK